MVLLPPLPSLCVLFFPLAMHGVAVRTEYSVLLPVLQYSVWKVSTYGTAAATTSTADALFRTAKYNRNIQGRGSYFQHDASHNLKYSFFTQ